MFSTQTTLDWHIEEIEDAISTEEELLLDAEDESASTPSESRYTISEFACASRKCISHVNRSGSTNRQTF